MGKKLRSEKGAALPRAIENRRARYEYEFLDTYEAGIALAGSEVKSVWLGHVNLVDAFCEVREGEAWIVNLDIEPYEHARAFALDRRRDRKLLLHKREIAELARQVSQKGMTLIPVKMYFKDGKLKVLVAVARGKREYDKRKQIADRETRREIERARARREV